MPRTSLNGMRCSVARTLDVIGEWWTMLIMRDAFRGVTRFEDFHRSLGIARTVLAARLDRLVDNGVFVRSPYSEHPPRSEYILTDKGRDLFPVLLTLMQWGDRWVSDDDPPMRLVHTPCEHVTSPRLACEHCDGDVAHDTVRPEPS